MSDFGPGAGAFSKNYLKYRLLDPNRSIMDQKPSIMDQNRDSRGTEPDYMPPTGAYFPDSMHHEDLTEQPRDGSSGAPRHQEALIRSVSEGRKRDVRRAQCAQVSRVPDYMP